MKFLEFAGVIIFILGLTAADSECLLIPIAMLVTGAMLYHIGTKEEV